MKAHLSIFLLFFSTVQLSEAQETCAKSLDESIQTQLTALDKRDLAAYMQIIPAREDQLVILPDGSTWATRSEIEQGHKEWFKDETWVFNRELVRKDPREHWGVVVYHVTVDRPDAPGKPFLLSMMFAPEADGCWYLQHDQNTVLVQEK